MNANLLQQFSQSDQKLCQKAVVRVQTLIRDSLSRFKASQLPGNENVVITIRNLLKCYSVLVDPIINRSKSGD
jgi:hypothetical protein